MTAPRNPTETAYTLAQELIWHADPTTSSYRLSDDGRTQYELTRPAHIDEDPDTIRRVDHALLERLRMEYLDARPALRKRVRLALRDNARRADRTFEGRDLWLATVLCRAAAAGLDIDLDEIKDRRLGYLAVVASEAIVGLVGTELERRTQLGYPADEQAILEI